MELHALAFSSWIAN